MKQTFRSLCLWAIMLLSILGPYVGGATQAVAQPSTDFDAQIQRGASALQASHNDAALSAGDAAIRMAPERWDGYALSGRALLAMKQFESAADALSKAIERAPAAQQPSLRELRREALVEESGAPTSTLSSPPISGTGKPAGAPTSEVAAAAATAQSVLAQPPAAGVAASINPPTARPKRGSKGALTLFSPNSPEAAWTDSSGLLWARPWYFPATDVGPFNYAQAKAVCAGLQLLGFQDWRLPTLEELEHVYLPSRKTFRTSPPKFDDDYGLYQAIKHDAWQLRDFTVGGDTFNANRLLIWSSTAGDAPGQHKAVYFGRAYSVDDDQRVGGVLPGTSRRNPFHAYALCARDAAAQASP